MAKGGDDRERGCEENSPINQRWRSVCDAYASVMAIPGLIFLVLAVVSIVIKWTGLVSWSWWIALIPAGIFYLILNACAIAESTNKPSDIFDDL